jgi:hypothetical protein
MTVLKQYRIGDHFLRMRRLFAVVSLLWASGILDAQGTSTFPNLPDTAAFRDSEAEGSSGVVRSLENGNLSDAAACEIVVAFGDGGGTLDSNVLDFTKSALLSDATQPSNVLPMDLDKSDSQPIALALVDPSGGDVPDFVLGAGTGVSLWPVNPKAAPSGAMPPTLTPTGQQTKRILGILPNFEAVSANTHLPPLSLKEKFSLATQNTFDYSSLISVGMQAAIEQARKTYPEFHEGAAAYGRYYWHTFADSGVENYLVGAIFPSITHEDPRYYTLGRGQVLERVRYAVSRLWITRSDASASTFNFSEIVGSGVSAEVSSRYYPREARTSGQTLERWASQLINDGVGNVVQEFWPDIHQKFFKPH